MGILSRLLGKRVLVTGASRGIGRGIAMAFAEEGASVAVTYHQRQDLAEEVVTAVRGLRGESFHVQADLGVEEDARRVIERVKEEWGGLDVLVNNAGILDPIRPGDVSVEAFRHTIDVNLTGTWVLCRLAAPLLKASRGSIVSISSIAGVVGYPYAAHYAAAKAGIVALTASLALELAPHVRVNAVAPGYINTGDPMGWDDVRMADLAKAIPMQRFGRPEDVARAVIYLGVDASYVTGTTLVVDGGTTVRLPGFMSGL